MHAKVIIPLFALGFQFINPCSPQNRPTRVPTDTDTIYDVQVVCIDTTGKPRTHDAEGEFEAAERAVITAAIESEVSQVLVGEGDSVIEGDPLIMLSGADLQNRIDLVKAEQKEVDARLKKAQSELKLLGKDEDKPMSIEDAKFLDEEDTTAPPPEPKNYGPAEPAQKTGTLREFIDVLSAMSERLAKKIEILEKQISDLTQKSPVKGIVTKVYVAATNKVDEKSALLDIVKTDPMSVVFSLPEDVANFVDKHSTVSVSLVDAPKITGEGTVYFIDPNLDNIKKTITIKAHVSNTGNEIKGGQKAKVTVSTRKIDEKKFLPKTALIFEKKKVYVYYVETNQARQKEVQVVGKEDDKGRFEIMTDLTSDDPVIVKKPEALLNGAFVKIMPEKENGCGQTVGDETASDTSTGTEE